LVFKKIPKRLGLPFTFVTEGIEAAVRRAKEAAGNKNVSLLGASIDQQCLKAGLADEIVFILCRFCYATVSACLIILARHR
jgi:dihydrofolate reductase